MGFIRSLEAIPVLVTNLTVCPQTSTNAPDGYVFPAAEALIAIGPAIGDCFARLKATKPLSVEESLRRRLASPSLAPAPRGRMPILLFFAVFIPLRDGPFHFTIR